MRISAICISSADKCGVQGKSARVQGHVPWLLTKHYAVLSSPFHLSIRGRCHSVPLYSEADKFDAFYSAVDRNILDIVIWLWNTLLVGYCLSFSHFKIVRCFYLASYGIIIIIVLYIFGSNNFYHVSVVLSRVLPSKMKNHLLGLLVFK